jgi:hypothetical protein
LNQRKDGSAQWRTYREPIQITYVRQIDTESFPDEKLMLDGRWNDYGCSEGREEVKKPELMEVLER